MTWPAPHPKCVAAGTCLYFYSWMGHWLWSILPLWWFWQYCGPPYPLYWSCAETPHDQWCCDGLWWEMVLSCALWTFLQKSCLTLQCTLLHNPPFHTYTCRSPHFFVAWFLYLLGLSPSQILQDHHYPAEFFQKDKPQQKTYKKPNPSTGKFIQGARVVILYIKGLSEQYWHTLAKYKVSVFFKDTSTIKAFLIHPKDPIPDAQKTDIIYRSKCPANNCTAEYIGENNRSLKERVSDHRNQTTSAIRNHHISTKHPKAELKDFTIIDRDCNTLHHQAKEALHIHIKDPLLNRNIGKVRIPSVLNKILKPPRQLELQHSSIPLPKRDTFFTWSFNT